MKGLNLAFGILLSQTSFVSASFSLLTNSPTVISTDDSVIPTNRFLIEFKDSNDLANGATDETAGFMKILESHGVKAEIAFKYSPIIFHGVSVSLSSSEDSKFIQDLAGVASVRQIQDGKSPNPISESRSSASEASSKKTSRRAISPAGGLTSRQASAAPPPLVIQKSQYQYTANASSVTFTHAKKNARSANLITDTTPVYAVFYSIYFADQFPDVYVPVYATSGNSGDFKLDRLPASPTGQVNIVLTTADGKTTKRSSDNIISGVGMIEVLPVGQRDPYPTTLKPWTPHTLTGVEELHTSGVRGKGVKIGLIDGGVAYKHPALGGGFGDGFKVVGGYDIAGDRYPWEGDALPEDLCTGSTAGVDMKLAALQLAYEDDVDIIQIAASNSGAPGGPEDPISAATARLAAEGIFISTAAENNGGAGAFFPMGGTQGKAVAAVGSIDLDQVRANVAYATITGKRGSQRQIPYLGGFGLGMEDPNTGFPLTATMPVIVVTGSCTLQVPANTPELSKYTVVVPRDCPWDEITAELGSRDPLVVLVYNTDPSQSMSVPDRNDWSFANMASISYEDGKFLVDTLNSGSKITMEYNWFPGVGVANKNSPGFMSDWSSWGPDYEGGLWPQVVAPGNLLMTTYHLHHNSFLDVAGTEAAAAYLTGVAALYYSQKGGKNALGKTGPQDLLNKMIATAKPIEWQDGTGQNIKTPFKKRDGTGLAPVAQQGGGLIDAAALLSTTTTLTPPYIQLGDKKAFKSTWNITVSNPSTESIIYSVSHDPSVTFLAINRETEYNMRPYPGGVTWEDKASLSFSSTSFTLAAGSSTSITVTITPPADNPDFPSKYIPVYSGYITLTSSTSETLHIPYQGINTDLHAEVPIWHEGTQPYPLGANYDYSKLLLPGEPIYTFYLDSPNDEVILQGFNVFGSEEMRIDIVDPAWTEEDWSNPPEKNFIGSMAGFPLSKVPRTQGYPWGYGFDGLLSNGTLLPPGRYKIMMSTLLPRGDSSKKEDWQIQETGLFDVAYLA